MRPRLQAGLLLATLALAGLAAQALPLSMVPMRDHRPVLIDGDRDWCDRVDAQGFDDDGVDCTEGDGSAAEPYVIRGWRFNLAAFPPGTAAITIHNTTRHWLVQHNLFTDTRQERLRDGLVLLGASDSRGRVEYNRFEHLDQALVAREWFHHQPCTLPGGGAGTCFWRRASAPEVAWNHFRLNRHAVLNGPQLGTPYTEATGAVRLNSFETTAEYAYLEVLPTLWRPKLAENWWGSPLGPTLDPGGTRVAGGRFWAQCAAAGAGPLGLPPPCVTPWLPAPNPAAGPLVVVDID